MRADRASANTIGGRATAGPADDRKLDRKRTAHYENIGVEELGAFALGWNLEFPVRNSGAKCTVGCGSYATAHASASHR
jgi:hypothetical protein